MGVPGALPATCTRVSGILPGMPTGERKNRKKHRLALTDGDVEVFYWLWMLRVLTLEQIRRLRYYQPSTGRLSSLDNVRKRLKRLWDAGYLQGDILRPGNERIYFLGLAALAPLRDRYGIDQRRLYQPRSTETMQQLRHPLMVAECAVRVEEALRGISDSSIETPELPPLWSPFYHTHAVGDASKKKHVERFVTQEDVRVPGHTRAYRIRPDLVFALAKENASRLYFLEADRGSEGPQEIAAKQLGYHHYRTARDPAQPGQLLWQRYGQDKRDYRVLFVTTHPRRIELLQRQLHAQPGYELMVFSTLDQVKTDNFVTAPIWTTAAGPGKALLRTG